MHTHSPQRPGQAEQPALAAESAGTVAGRGPPEPDVEAGSADALGHVDLAVGAAGTAAGGTRGPPELGTAVDLALESARA